MGRGQAGKGRACSLEALPCAIVINSYLEKSCLLTKLQVVHFHCRVVVHGMPNLVTLRLFSVSRSACAAGNILVRAALLRGCGLGDRGPALTDVPRIALHGAVPGCSPTLVVRGPPRPHGACCRLLGQTRCAGPDIPFLCIGLDPRSISQLVATQISGPDFPEFHFLYVGSFLCFLRILDVLCVFWIHRPSGLAYVFTLLAACRLRHREAFHCMWSVLLSSVCILSSRSSHLP